MYRQIRFWSGKNCTRFATMSPHTRMYASPVIWFFTGTQAPGEAWARRLHRMNRRGAFVVCTWTGTGTGTGTASVGARRGTGPGNVPGAVPGEADGRGAETIAALAPAAAAVGTARPRMRKRGDHIVDVCLLLLLLLWGGFCCWCPRSLNHYRWTGSPPQPPVATSSESV